MDDRGVRRGSWVYPIQEDPDHHGHVEVIRPENRDICRIRAVEVELRDPMEMIAHVEVMSVIPTFA